MTTWVLLRGLARESRHWGDVPDRLRRHLPDGARVVAIDLPGNGRWHGERSPCSVAAMVRSCREQLAREGVAGPYAVLGLSLGAMVALQWSHEHPGEVAAAVLVNGSFGGHGRFWQRLRPGAWLPLASLLRPGASALERERQVLAMTSTRAAGDDALAHRWARYANDRPVSRANALRQLLAAARFRAPAEAPAVPLLLLASLQDALVSPQASRALASRWGVVLKLHSGAGHDMALDAPAWLVVQAVDWWRRQRRSPAS